jgi:hypothetical protein
LPRGRRKPTLAALQPIAVRSAQGWRYQWHEEILKRSDLSRSEIAVAGALMHAFRSDRGYAEMGLRKLAENAGCSRSRAQLATQRLRALGLVVVVNERVRACGRQLATHRYRLVYLSRGVM